MTSSFTSLGVAAGTNVAIMVVFLVLYTIFSKQTINARVYFTKWFVVDKKSAERRLEKLDSTGVEREGSAAAALEPEPGSILHAADWLVQVLFMPQTEFLAHAGLDALAFLKLFQLALKLFVPMAFLGFAVLVPLNATDNFLDELIRNNSADYGEIDRLSLANIGQNSSRLWAHFVMAYLFTFWAWYILGKEYKEIAGLRLDYLADQKKQPDQFTVLVRQVPVDPFESISRHVDHFFHVNHPDYYVFNQVVFNANQLSSLERKKNWVVNKLTALHIKMEKHSQRPRPTHKTKCCGCYGTRVDSVEFYDEELARLNLQIEKERKRILSDTSSIMPAAFVTFRKRWAAAVAAQTQQSRDSSHWITEWAPEPRDVFWANLPIPYLQLSGRRLLISGALVGLVIFFMFPVTFVQSLANLDSLQTKLPWLEPVISVPFINSFLQGFLPGLALKIFLALVPHVCVLMSQVEGWVSHSSIERKAMGKYFYVLVVNVFWASVITGTIAEQVQGLIEKPTEIPTTFGNAIPTKAVFFMTFVMVDGWAGLTSELFRLIPVIIYHLYGLLLVRTPKDREKAMNVQGMFFTQNIGQALLYILLGFVYSVITPLLLPFLVVFFGLGYLIYRNQLINVYDAQYESAASFWPSVHGRIVAAMIIQHVVLIGSFAVKQATVAGPCLLPLPVLTIVWHYVFCKYPFENAFKLYSLEEAMKKDTIDGAYEDPEYTTRDFLHHAYLHPAVKRAMDSEVDEEVELWRKKTGIDGPRLVALKRYPAGTRSPSLLSDSNAESESEAKKELGETRMSRDGDTSDGSTSAPIGGWPTPSRQMEVPLLATSHGSLRAEVEVKGNHLD